MNGDPTRIPSIPFPTADVATSSASSYTSIIKLCIACTIDVRSRKVNSRYVGSLIIEVKVKKNRKERNDEEGCYICRTSFSDVYAPRSTLGPSSFRSR